MTIQKGLPSIRRVHAKTTESFITEARTIHGRKYDYAQANYTAAYRKITITCSKHGNFEQRPNSHLRGSGCPECSKLLGIQNNPQRLTTKDFIKAAKKIHGNRYDYSNTEYTSARQLVKIRCTEHGLFEQRAKRHLQGHCCRKCGTRDAGLKRLDTTERFIQKAKLQHGDLYDYSKTKYERSNLPVSIICLKHGEFSQKANNHIQGAGCPRCRTLQLYSKVSIKWINEESKKRRLRNVQHAENGGEVRIPGTRYWVDGYHHRTKTIFEFYGDAFHGNPAVYEPTDCPHPFNDSTARVLHSATLKRHGELLALGYNVVFIWEQAYKEQANEYR